MEKILGNYDEELTLYAKKIFLMFKTSSINWKAVSLKDFIWIETAFYVEMEMQSKIKSYEMEVYVDLRALIKDLDDIQRIKLTGNKNSVLNWNDLPSQRKNQPQLENNVEMRKAFLKDLSDRYKNK